MLALARIFYFIPALLLGLTLSQAPEFAQQYRQRLGGALDELEAIVQRFTADARRQGLEPQAAIGRLETNPDPLARDRGADMRIVVDRRDRLARQMTAFESGGPFARLAELVVDFDPDLAAGAWKAFEPAIPVTLEDAVAAGAGVLAGLFASEATRVGWKRRRARKLAARRV